MNFRDTAAQSQWRNEVRTVLAQEFAGELRGRNIGFTRPEESPALNQWRTVPAERGWIASAWPKEFGGAGLSPLDQFVLNEEFAEAGAPSLGGLGVMMLGPTLITHGTPEQKREHLPRILQGETNWCQGYSEPGSGSDLASLQT